jgi:hypothetical protein
MPDRHTGRRRRALGQGRQTAATCPRSKIAPVDTVGAGDTFCGYLAQGLDAGMGSKGGRAPRSRCRGAGLPYARRAAVYPAGLKTSTPGCDQLQSRPTRSMNRSKKRSASTPPITSAFSLRSVTFHQSTTVAPRVSSEPVSISTLQ